MDKTEFESLVKQLKAAGLNEEQIMETFYETFQDGKMDRKDLEALAEFMGYELTDEFKNDPTADPIAGGEGEEKGAEGAEGGDLAAKAEDLKEIQPGESKEEFQEKVEEAKEEAPAPEAEPEKEPEAKESKPEGEDEIDEDKEWEEVQKKFHW